MQFSGTDPREAFKNGQNQCVGAVGRLKLQNFPTVVQFSCDVMRCSCKTRALPFIMLPHASLKYDHLESKNVKFLSSNGHRLF